MNAKRNLVHEYIHGGPKRVKIPDGRYLRIGLANAELERLDAFAKHMNVSRMEFILDAITSYKWLIQAIIVERQKVFVGWDRETAKEHKLYEEEEKEVSIFAKQ